MANMSTAEGTITLKGSVKSIKAFLVISQTITDWDYTLHLHNEDQYLDELSDKTGVTERTYPVFGIGRWSFEETLKSLFRWIDELRNNEIKWTSAEESAWQQLNQDPLHLTLTYIDYDNSEFFVKERTTMHWYRKKIDEPIIDTTVLESYDMDAKHYDKLTAERYYDYSTYTIEKMKDEAVDWVERIQNTPLSDRVDLDVFKSHTDAVLDDLGRYLDDVKDDYGNALWVEIPEWFDDEEVQDGIAHVLAKYTKQNTH